VSGSVILEGEGKGGVVKVMTGVAAAAMAYWDFHEILVVHDGFQFHRGGCERVLPLFAGASVAPLVEKFLATRPDELEHGKSAGFDGRVRWPSVLTSNRSVIKVKLVCGANLGLIWRWNPAIGCHCKAVLRFLFLYVHIKTIFVVFF